MTEPHSDLLHDAYRALISLRLDEPLSLNAQTDLCTHLAVCSWCRQFEHDLLEQRRLLRSLPAPVPPRDLWARTSAALDRELLRDAERGGALAPEAPPRASGRLGELADPRSLPSAVMVAMSSATLAVLLLITQLGPSLRLPSTGVTGEATPFGPPGVALAFVGTDAGGLTLYRTRPDQDCPQPSSDCDEIAARVTFPASFQPNNLALAPRGDRLAIMGSDSERENVFAVVVVPPPAASKPENDFPSRPRTNGGAATASAEPGSSLIVVGRTPPPSVAPNAPGATLIPAEIKVSTILDGVYGVGAAPAWSADGQSLAFSAMPSDRSRGPDIYVWRVGDERARPITSDHGSYFASWSGTAIVISRAAATTGVGLLLAPAPDVQTIEIDVATAEERTVAADGLWLPQVDPFSHRAVAWHGTLAWDGRQIVPRHGALYLVDWRSIDPFAVTEPAPTPDRDDIDRQTMVIGAEALTPPTDQQAAATNGPSAPSGPSAPVATPLAPRAVVATEAPTPRADPRLVAIEPGRDVLQHPVTDWRVMWAADARSLGIWVGDVGTTVWGHLMVLAVDLQGRLDRAAPVLSSTLAKRGFNLGSHRVAWVAPAPLEGVPAGELRVRMWSTDEVRDVRVKPLEPTGVVAAF